MKPLVIYHANCTDGFGAAFAAWLKLGDEAEYIPMDYGEVETPEDFDMKVSLAAKGNTIYILDFSFPRSVMEALFTHAEAIGGMSLRDYFAAKAMPLAWKIFDEGYSPDKLTSENIARAAYQMADAMLVARKE